MKSATNTPPHPQPAVLPEVPANDVTAGIDWSRDDHAVSIVNGRGQEIDRSTIEHTASGLRDLITTLARFGVGETAIERPDGPVVDNLLQAGITVVVISPNQVKNLRSRYGSAGNKDDRFDAFVLADTLRTDRTRLVPLTPDSPATITLRRTCRARKDLVEHRVAITNQLRAHLHNALPGAIGLFRDLDSPISLAFLTRFDTQDRADWLTPKRLTNWLASVGYPGGKDPAILHAHLTTAPRGTTGHEATLNAHITHAYLALLTTVTDQIKILTHQIADQLATHTDTHIFTNLPRTSTIRTARLLTEIGDSRGRFPTPEALTCLAGVAPSTRQSGKHKTVAFRWACDKQLRNAVTDFAGDTRHANPWAANLYQQARNRGHDHPHAVRILARAWLHIIWHCWQNNTPYDPTQHRALQRHLNPTKHQQA
jgi:transposase